MGVEMLPLKSNRPRCFHRGLKPTGNPQSKELPNIMGGKRGFSKALFYQLVSGVSSMDFKITNKNNNLCDISAKFSSDL